MIGDAPKRSLIDVEALEPSVDLCVLLSELSRDRGHVPALGFEQPQKMGAQPLIFVRKRRWAVCGDIREFGSRRGL